MSNGSGQKADVATRAEAIEKIGGIKSTHDHDWHLWNHHTEAIEQIFSHNTWNRDVEEHGAESGGICRDFRDSLWSGNRSVDFIAGPAQGMTDQREHRWLVIHHQNRSAFAGCHPTSLGGARTGGQLLRRCRPRGPPACRAEPDASYRGNHYGGTGATTANGSRQRRATDRRLNPAS